MKEIEFLGDSAVSETARTLGGEFFGRISIALHFAQRDRTLRQCAVRMEYGVEGIFPPLITKTVLQSFGVGAPIFQKAVAVPVAERLHPSQGFFGRWPQFAQCRLIPRTLHIKTEQDDEQRRMGEHI